MGGNAAKAIVMSMLDGVRAGYVGSTFHYSVILLFVAFVSFDFILCRTTLPVAAAIDKREMYAYVVFWLYICTNPKMYILLNFRMLNCSRYVYSLLIFPIWAVNSIDFVVIFEWSK